jgi:hypothetical protein
MADPPGPGGVEERILPTTRFPTADCSDRAWDSNGARSNVGAAADRLVGTDAARCCRSEWLLAFTAGHFRLPARGHREGAAGPPRRGPPAASGLPRRCRWGSTTTTANGPTSGHQRRHERAAVTVGVLGPSGIRRWSVKPGCTSQVRRRSRRPASAGREDDLLVAGIRDRSDATGLALTSSAPREPRGSPRTPSSAPPRVTEPCVPSVPSVHSWQHESRLPRGGNRLSAACRSGWAREVSNL